jgi:hypothetical protein
MDDDQAMVFDIVRKVMISVVDEVMNELYRTISRKIIYLIYLFILSFLT